MPIAMPVEQQHQQVQPSRSNTIGEESCGDLDTEIQNLLKDGELLLTPRVENSGAARSRDALHPQEFIDPTAGSRDGKRVPSRPTTAQADELVCEEMSRARCCSGSQVRSGIPATTLSPFGGLPVLNEDPRPSTAQAEQLISEEIRTGLPRRSPEYVDCIDMRQRVSESCRPQNPNADLLNHQEGFRPSYQQGLDEIARPSTAQVEALIREEFRNHQHLSLNSMGYSVGASPSSMNGSAISGVGGRSSSSYCAAGAVRSLPESARLTTNLRTTAIMGSAGSPLSSAQTSAQMNASRPSTAQVEQLVSEEMGFLRPWPDSPSPGSPAVHFQGVDPNVPVPDLLELMDVSGRQVVSATDNPTLRAAVVDEQASNSACAMPQRLAPSETLADLPEADRLVLEDIEDNGVSSGVTREIRADKRLSELFKDILGEQPS